MSKLRTRPYDKDNAGAVSLSEAEITFSAAAARQLIDTLPAGAVILAAWVEVLVAFNATVSNLVTVGFGAIGAGTADDYVATVNEAAAGVNGQATPGVPFAALAADQEVYAYYTPGAADASAGQARAFLLWTRTAENGEA